MTESYILYLQTELPVDAVLTLIFEPKSISPLEGTNMLYARGNVFLAHGQPLPPQMQERHETQFGFAPTISVRYFPDGVSSVNTAMKLLIEGIVRWMSESDDNLVLTANQSVEVLKRVDNQLMIDTSHAFWRNDRLKTVQLPYQEL